MRFTSRTSSDGVTEQLFTFGEIPGVLWTPDGAAGGRPLILMGHGGGQTRCGFSPGTWADIPVVRDAPIGTRSRMPHELMLAGPR
jgi:dipeptidyl aminopeptidase/acylaminoacyl peptidase